jgi:hypothetical protein
VTAQLNLILLAFRRAALALSSSRISASMTNVSDRHEWHRHGYLVDQVNRVGASGCHARDNSNQTTSAPVQISVLQLRPGCRSEWCSPGLAVVTVRMTLMDVSVILIWDA